MDDEELSQLAVRVQLAQKEMVGGALTNEQLTYIVIALAAAVLVRILIFKEICSIVDSLKQPLVRFSISRV